jgi:Cu2+-exporting ATPase
MRLVAEAQTSRSRAQALADRAAYWLTLAAIGVALLALVVWGIARGLDNYTLERVVTTLVVACPHALGLAIPLVIAISTTLSARNGILVRDRLALERARNLNVVVFDKTGTLTQGEQGLVDSAATSELTAEEALALAAAVERDSEHPIAQALVRAAAERGAQLPTATDFTALPGRGVQAKIHGQLWQAGGPRLLEQAGAHLPAALADAARAWGERGQTVVYLLEEHQPRAPSCCNARTRALLCSGSTCAKYSVMFNSPATQRATSSASPVSIATRTPCPCSVATAARLSGRMTSASANAARG